MRRMSLLMTAIAVICLSCVPMLSVWADGGPPQVISWSVSSDHGGEVRGDNTDDQYITMIVGFDQEIRIEDTQKAYDEFSVMLNNKIDITSQAAYTNGEDWPVYGSLKGGEDGKSVVFDLHYGYAPYASCLTIIPKGQVTQITGVDGIPVIWKDVSLFFPNGVTFTTIDQTVGSTESNTPASVTTRVYAPADSTRMMIHVLLLKNGQSARELDSYGSNLTTHFHDYLNLTAAGYADLFKGWFTNTFGNDYNIEINGEEITVKSKIVADGDVLDLRIFAYPQDRDTGADKSYLASVISNAESVSASDYTVASWRMMNNQLYRAKAVNASIYYTQDEVNAAAEELNTLITKLQKRDALNDDSQFPFSDVAIDRWSRPAIVYVFNRHLFNGVSEDVFSPSDNMNRAMLVTVLYRMDGSEPVAGEVPFTDTPDDSYYYDAVKWACARGIVNGMTAFEFEPETYLTREQLATILYRYAGYKGHDVSSAADLNGYQDASMIGQYAERALQWAVGEGLINGITTTELSPRTGATREQVASILMRFCTKYQ